MRWLGRLVERMNKAPNKYTLRELLDTVNGGTSVGIGGKWYPARPLGYYSLRSRLKCAWLVFTGQADAVTWPEDERPNDEMTSPHKKGDNHE
jgi:hypothetical protein